MNPELSRSLVVGDVFQINEKDGRKGWIGAFVLATRIEGWGIVGFVAHVATRDQQHHAYIRLPWDHVDYIGHAPLLPADLAQRINDSNPEQHGN